MLEDPETPYDEAEFKCRVIQNCRQMNAVNVMAIFPELAALHPSAHNNNLQSLRLTLAVDSPGSCR